MIITNRYNDIPWINWFCICFFGLGYPFALFNLFDRRPQIIINETGIFDRTAYNDFVNWNTIDHAYWITIHKQPFVCLIIKEEYKDLIKGSPRMKKVNEAMGFQEINISLGSVSNVDQQKLTALIINLANAKPMDRSRMLAGYTLNTPK
ncbi:hypothetical protein GO620_009340 [Mucilaginibacter ginkgonis]|uniref:Uncharacterized protein n=2 Tax=Mucilaginibacter ginkgonis TaxID=2682091 RepID=A0A6I4I131_9SPHI|nr:STM3941 family protein [Mucilaginibacter ginkgonis]QQL48398.1 hypothetical protein GO620_009340 [Mucilaginibacter ginkgonis]